MPRAMEGERSAAGVRLAIVAARFNSHIVDRLLDGAIHAIKTAGGDPTAVPVARVPGSMELAVAARKFALTGNYDAVICLGCIIRGETTHYDCVVNGATQGITAVSSQTGVPVIFGVLTCDTEQQALARAGDDPDQNAGAYSARAAVEMANLLKKI